MSTETIGFIGLGNMGGAIARRIAGAGFPMVAYDIAGTAERAPEGAGLAQSVGEVARRSGAIYLSLPSLASFETVVAEIAEAAVGADAVVVNTSTVGPPAALAAAQRLREKGIAFADAPVSGGVPRAEAGRLSVMFSGEAALLGRLRPCFESFGANIFDIGAEPGQAQRMKLVNNTLVISAMTTIAEALAYGEKGGLDLATMLEVINVSTGRNFVSEHIYPRHVVTESYDSAGGGAIIRKDLSLFVQEASGEGRRHGVATAALELVEAYDDARPGSDQTEMYPYVRDGE